MSVRDLLKDEKIRELVDSLLPDLQRPSLRLKVRAGRKSGGLVGTAFDYSVRFELERRHPAARCEKWTAEKAVESVSFADDAEFTIEGLNRAGEVVLSLDSTFVAR